MDNRVILIFNIGSVLCNTIILITMKKYAKALNDFLDVMHNSKYNNTNNK